MDHVSYSKWTIGPVNREMTAHHGTCTVSRIWEKFGNSQYKQFETVKMNTQRILDTTDDR